jgi:predicted ribosomally synthesized peptide with nif11-like leader
MRKFTCPLKAMSEEQLKAFLEAIKADAGLQEQLQAAAEADAVVAIAKAAGFVISVEELKNAKSLITDEELESLAGGHSAYYCKPEHVSENNCSGISFLCS